MKFKTCTESVNVKFHSYSIASDFFYPNMGGVEEHIFNLSQCLLKNGHKVIVLTHSYGNRKGVRYMTGGLKVYYLPIHTFYSQCILPTMMCNIPLLRYILIREQIEIVHGHSAFSALAHEVMFVGKLLGLRVRIILRANQKLIETNEKMSIFRWFLRIIRCLDSPIYQLLLPINYLR